MTSRIGTRCRCALPQIAFAHASEACRLRRHAKKRNCTTALANHSLPKQKRVSLGKHKQPGKNYGTTTPISPRYHATMLHNSSHDFKEPSDPNCPHSQSQHAPESALYRLYPEHESRVAPSVNLYCTLRATVLHVGITPYSAGCKTDSCSRQEPRTTLLLIIGAFGSHSRE